MLPEICITITWTRNAFQIVGAAGRESTCANCGFTGFLNCFSSWIGGQFFIYFWLKCWKQRKKNLKMLKYTRRDFCMRFQREKNYGDFAKAQDCFISPSILCNSKMSWIRKLFWITNKKLLLFRCLDNGYNSSRNGNMLISRRCFSARDGILKRLRIIVITQHHKHHSRRDRQAAVVNNIVISNPQQTIETTAVEMGEKACSMCRTMPQST